MLTPDVVKAEELQVSLYAIVCPSCQNKLKYQTYTYYEDYIVSSCANSSRDHTHTDEVFETGYVCTTFGCEAEGFYLNKTITVMETVCKFYL